MENLETRDVAWYKSKTKEAKVYIKYVENHRRVNKLLISLLKLFVVVKIEEAIKKMTPKSKPSFKEGGVKSGSEALFSESTNEVYILPSGQHGLIDPDRIDSKRMKSIISNAQLKERLPYASKSDIHRPRS